MALKLSKAQLTTRDGIVSRLRSTHDNLDRAIAAFNAALAAARDAIQPQIDAYGEAMKAAREFAGEVAAGAQEAIDAKPERWQGSAKGKAAVAFQEAWDGLDLDDDDVDLPDDLDDLDDLDADPADALADAPAEPE